jgi:hypothetical protein
MQAKSSEKILRFFHLYGPLPYIRFRRGFRLLFDQDFQKIVQLEEWGRHSCLPAVGGLESRPKRL